MSDYWQTELWFCTCKTGPISCSNCPVTEKNNEMESNDIGNDAMQITITSDQLI